MTRPMPGPHDSPLHEGKEWFYACTACSGLWSESDEWAAEEKRLTGTECAAEFWSVWRNILRYDHGDPDRGEAIQQANTWLRFATHPHALEES